MKVEHPESLLYGIDIGFGETGFRPVNPQPVTLEHAIVWSNIVGYLVPSRFDYELHVLLLELRRLAAEGSADG